MREKTRAFRVEAGDMLHHEGQLRRVESAEEMNGRTRIFLERHPEPIELNLCSAEVVEIRRGSV